jgi:predicted enzyme related to lactoylglutathione lyase
MASVTGIGGVFLRAADPEALYAWYEQHLGVRRRDGCLAFDAVTQRARSVVAFFPRDDEYFPTTQPTMLNFQVDDLDALLDRLSAQGITVDARRERYDYGSFGWFTDPEGNRVELWQPAPESAEAQQDPPDPSTID